MALAQVGVMFSRDDGQGTVGAIPAFGHLDAETLTRAVPGGSPGATVTVTLTADAVYELVNNITPVAAAAAILTFDGTTPAASDGGGVAWQPLMEPVFRFHTLPGQTQFKIAAQTATALRIYLRRLR